ncbi:hypothetical protein VZT92_004560 [Zoarces viviparus]|uniref:Uncharacterized protein n=1 Tax=Zoarces viviparus TaxID=48416 RepID=A0AAW1FYM5_ZOAVI
MDRLISLKYAAKPALLPPNVSPRYGRIPALLPTPNVSPRYGPRPALLPTPNVSPRYGWRPALPTIEERDEARADPLPALTVEPEQQCEGINNLEDLKGPQTKKKRWGFSFFTKKKQENSNKTGCWSWLRCNKRARESNLEESVVQ